MRHKKAISFLIIGLVLVVVGIALAFTLKQPQKPLEKLLYVCIVIIGCLIFGHNLGKLVIHFSLKDNPELLKSIEIEQNDERNVMIYNMATAKAFDIMTSYVNIAILMLLALMQRDIWIILLFSTYNLLAIMLKVFYLLKYHKKM